MNLLKKNVFDGLHVCVTGRVRGYNRKELEAVLCELGAVLDKKVTTTTNILVAADSSRRRRTSKIRSAEAFHVPMKSPEWLSQEISNFRRYLKKLLPASVDSGTLRDRVKVHRWLRRENVTAADVAVLLSPSVYNAARNGVINSRDNLRDLRKSSAAATSTGVFL